MTGASLTAEVARVGWRAVVGALAVAGVATSAVLVVVEASALDAALSAAVQESARREGATWLADAGQGWHAHAPPTALVLEAWAPGHPLVSDALASAVLADESPRWLDVSGRRVLVTVLEPAHAEGDGPLLADEDHPHAVIVAHAPAVTPLGSAGPFLAVWAPLSATVALGAAAWLRRRVHAAVAPLREVAFALEHALGEARRARLAPSPLAEVAQVVAATNTLLDRLDQAFAAQARFTAEAAHELRTPVTVLLGEIELARRRPRSAPEHEAILARLHVEVERLRERVEALMALARVDAGQADTVREREHVSALVHAALQAERLGVDEVRTELGPDPEVEVHAGLLALALGNLLRNARRHAPGAPAVVRTSLAGRAVRICVDDRGPGVPEADRERVFQRFARGGGDGLGLGLPIAREIARRHGGDLRLAEAPGGGCRAELSLPLPNEVVP